MSLLFTPIKIGPMTIKNRFMRSPTYESLGNPDGTPKPRLLKMIERLSEGEVGLIIPGYVYTMENGKAAPRQCGLINQQQAYAWKSTIEKVHKNGSKLAFQLCHGGAGVNKDLEKVAPTAIPYFCKGLTTSEVEDIIDSFHKSALLAKSCGADGIEIHGAHGYLFSLFLSPLFNRRNDKYGGSLEGRARVISETAEAIRKSAGPDFSVLIKMNGNDFLPFSTTPELAAQYVNHLKSKIDLFEISCGIGNPDVIIRTKKVGFINKYFYHLKLEEGYNLKFAEYIKRKNPDANIACVGGFKTLSVMEDAVRKEKTDIISMSRALIREPDLVKRFQLHQATKSACKSDNYCIHHSEDHERGLSCNYP
ncbi:hypothetical protein M9Y10_045805 [Tritrichomonas musculus]|uniref:NADH:flavin oxidoreductase/NADH oxidase N-terminal domain-containing protein n=1 Tax=Tritrichomonas musculus TaxID=1915356 RepID=A0ABR2JY09_9EUKA